MPGKGWWHPRYHWTGWRVILLSILKIGWCGSFCQKEKKNVSISASYTKDVKTLRQLNVTVSIPRGCASRQKPFRFQLSVSQKRSPWLCDSCAIWISPSRQGFITSSYLCKATNLLFFEAPASRSAARRHHHQALMLFHLYISNICVSALIRILLPPHPPLFKHMVAMSRRLEILEV